MSDMNPPGNGALHVEPGQAVGAYMPDLADTSTDPVPVPELGGVGMPPGTGKPRTDVLFFILGLFSPFVLQFLLTLLASVAPWVYSVIYLTTGVLFLVYLAMLLVGRSKGNVRMASFGKGGLWSYVISALLALAAFGFCLVSFNNYGR